MCHAKPAENPVCGVGVFEIIKIAQNVQKHILVLELFFLGGGEVPP